MKHFLCFFSGFLACGMCCMTFLPKEFGCTKERTGAHFPTHYVAPLVAHDRQVTPTVNPSFVSIPYNRFTGRTNDEFFVKLSFWVYDYTVSVITGFEAIMCYDSTFFGKAFDVFCLTREETFGDKEREIGILCTCFLEHFVELFFHLLPDSETVWFDDHATTYRSLLCKVCLYNQIIVPLTVIVCTLG